MTRSGASTSANLVDKAGKVGCNVLERGGLVEQPTLV